MKFKLKLVKQGKKGKKDFRQAFKGYLFVFEHKE